MINRIQMLTLIAVVALSSNARALDVTVSAGANVYVGQVSGDAWAVVRTGSTCNWFFLGSGGLTQDTNLIGTTSDDSIELVSSSWSGICGFTFTPLVTNGHAFKVKGGSGADYISNQVVNGVSLFGEGGNDMMYSLGTPAPGGSLPPNVDGGSGSDNIWGDSADNLYGGSGAYGDHFCGISGTVNYVAGGTGSDAIGASGDDDYCGVPVSFTHSVESVRAPGCGC